MTVTSPVREIGGWDKGQTTALPGEAVPQSFPERRPFKGQQAVKAVTLGSEDPQSWFCDLQQVTYYECVSLSGTWKNDLRWDSTEHLLSIFCVQGTMLRLSWAIFHLFFQRGYEVSYWYHSIFEMRSERLSNLLKATQQWGKADPNLGSWLSEYCSCHL